MDSYLDQNPLAQEERDDVTKEIVCWTPLRTPYT